MKFVFKDDKYQMNWFREDFEYAAKLGAIINFDDVRRSWNTVFQIGVKKTGFIRKSVSAIRAVNHSFPIQEV